MRRRPRRDRFIGRRTADQPLDDGARGLLRDPAHIAHGGLLGGGDGLFRVRQFDVELILEGLAAGIRFCRLPVARLIGDRLRAAARVGERLLVGGDRLVGFGLQRAGLGDVVFDVLLAGSR